MYWVSDIITVSGWQKSGTRLICDGLALRSLTQSPLAASMISLGLDWRQSLIITAVGSIILAIPMVLNGKIGSVLHIPFPIAVRMSHGYNFAWFPIVSRVVIAFVWFGIQCT